MREYYRIKDADHAEEIFPHSMKEYRELAASIDGIQYRDTVEASKAELLSHRVITEPETHEGRQEKALRGLLEDPQGPDRRAPELSTLRQFLRIIEVALNDAKRKGPDNDWVTTLNARDWIRSISFEYLQEIAPDAAPTQKAFDQWMAEIEDAWVRLDDSLPDDPVTQLEAPGRGIPVGLAIQYLLEIQYLTITGETELRRLNEKGSEILSSIKTLEDVQDAILEVAAMLRLAAPRIKHVGDRASVNADKLDRLRGLIERRGLES